jgi:hypothetical protein
LKEAASSVPSPTRSGIISPSAIELVEAMQAAIGILLDCHRLFRPARTEKTIVRFNDTAFSWTDGGCPTGGD